jgi:hypothetical protein
MTGRTGRAGRTGYDRGAGACGRLRQAIAAAAVLGVLAAVTPILPAAAVVAAGPVGNGRFGLTPAPDSNGGAAPYFTLTVAAGHSATRTALLSNLGSASEKLRVSRSTGVTAVNGGSAFSRSFQRCSGAGCWVTGLPGMVTLSPRTSVKLPFTVHVPPGTADGQYLAGITAELARRPPAVKVGSNGKATARAVIIEQVTVAVVVTVGPLARLTTRLRIRDVSGAAIGPVARLSIALDNTGQTFARGTGWATCTVAGQRHSSPVNAATVLAHDHATIAVNARGIPEGTAVPCTVEIHYGNDLTARWAGLITVPAPPRTRIYHTGPGAYSVVPEPGIPAWAIALAVLGVLLLAVLAVLAVLLMRTRRRSQAGLP